MFEGRHFDQLVVLLCVRWYLAFGLTLRNLEEMKGEHGIAVVHSTVSRWVRHCLRSCWRASTDASALYPGNGIWTRPV
jgi:transposase-like protein